MRKRPSLAPNAQWGILADDLYLCRHPSSFGHALGHFLKHTTGAKVADTRVVDKKGLSQPSAIVFTHCSDEAGNYVRVNSALASELSKSFSNRTDQSQGDFDDLRLDIISGKRH